MKAILIKILLLLSLVLLNQCEKDVPEPNENWIPGGTWTDTRDGHQYSTIPIGDQVWMADNLAFLPSVNKLQDGSEAGGHEDDSFYYVIEFDASDVTAAKETSNYRQFGVLYNWNAAKDACPDGWHLPSDFEWMELELNLGISEDEVNNSGFRGTDEGMKIKSTWGWDYDAWYERYGNGTNETGFTGLPGGDRWFDMYVNYPDTTYEFSGPGQYGIWWSSTKADGDWVWVRGLIYNHNNIYRYQSDKNYGNSVRCIKSDD